MWAIEGDRPYFECMIKVFNPFISVTIKGRQTPRASLCGSIFSFQDCRPTGWRSNQGGGGDLWVGGCVGEGGGGRGGMVYTWVDESTCCNCLGTADSSKHIELGEQPCSQPQPRCPCGTIRRGPPWLAECHRIRDSLLHRPLQASETEEEDV